MVTTKKTSNTKKSSTIKSAKNAKNTARPWTWRFSFLTIGIYAIAVMTVVVGALFASHTLMAEKNQMRLGRIEAIYSSLNLNESYQVKDTNVFGDKRVYPYEKGRTFPSEINYIHGDTVSNTVAKLNDKIKAAGFAFIGEPYPGTMSTQYHYKSSNGEYIRLTVSSKPYDDSVTNAYVLGKDASTLSASSDKNAAPSNITIKVNLNDNNE